MAHHCEKQYYRFLKAGMNFEVKYGITLYFTKGCRYPQGGKPYED